MADENPTIQSAAMTDIDIPGLPEPSTIYCQHTANIDGYTADQMRAYVHEDRANVARELAARPVTPASAPEALSDLLKEVLADACYAEGETCLSSDHYRRLHEAMTALAARPDWQKRAVEAGFVYVRASDDHWVECTQEQAASLLIDVLNIRVEIAAPEHASAPEALSLPNRIAELIEQHGSLRAAARVLECDPGYLSRLQSGEKDDPGALLLRRMGLRQITTYERSTPAAKWDQIAVDHLARNQGAPSTPAAVPVAYVDGDNVSRRILWRDDVAAFDFPVGTTLFAALSTPAAEPEKWILGPQTSSGYMLNPEWDAATPAAPSTPADDKIHPRFIAGYDAGLKDGRHCATRDAATQAQASDHVADTGNMVPPPEAA